MGPLIVILVVLGIAWVLFGIPARRRTRAHAAMQDSITTGDEIITAGGLHAVVKELGDRELKVEIAPNVVVTLDRRAVAAVAETIEPDPEPETTPEAS